MVNILVLEDDFILAQDYKNIIEGMGHTAVIAATGTEALHHCEVQRFELAVVDIFIKQHGSFADDGGIFFISNIRRLRERQFRTYSRIPIIAISGASTNNVTDAVLGSAESVGANASLAKPFDMSALTELIKQLLN